MAKTIKIIELEEIGNIITFKYPKTDYTYSTVSKDRVELAPGQVAMPNMSRRSLQHFATFGPNTSLDGMDELISQNSWTSSVRQRMKNADTSDDEDGIDGYKNKGPQKRFWLTTWFLSIITTITTTVTEAYRKVVGPPHRYPYTNLPPKQGALSRAGGLLAAPFVFIYSFIKKVFTSTVTTIEETITAPPSVHKYTQYNNYSVRSVAAPVHHSRRWWWLLLLIPLVGYASYYTYENFDDITLPDFKNIKIDLSEFSPTFPEFQKILPEINISLPDISDKMPDLPKTYYEYKDIVHNRMGDASDYVKVVADSCYEEIRRFWKGVAG